jgi:arginase
MGMNKKLVSIISFNSNLGLIEPAPGLEPCVKKLPARLRKSGFFDLIDPQEVIELEPPPYNMHLDPVSDMRNSDSIAAYAKKQVPILQDFISRKNFALVLGGDCSILIGNALALKKQGEYKLFFIDGHTDFMWPSLSSTHVVAGMDLAIVTGHGHEKLSNIDGYQPYFRETDTWCVGNREYYADYVAAIEKTSIHYYDLITLRKSGMTACFDSFFAGLSADQPDGFWIHLDVDVLDPLIMPAVDSPDPGGLNYPELTSLLEPLLSHPLCTGMEITILDPDRDPDGKLVQEFISQVGSTIISTVTGQFIRRYQ